MCVRRYTTTKSIMRRCGGRTPAVEYDELATRVDIGGMERYKMDGKSWA